MSSIQAVPSHPSPVQAAPKPVAPKQVAPRQAAPKLEVNETAQDERNEALGGKQEVGEAQSKVGGHFSATA